MAQSVELLIDDEAEAEVRRQRQVLNGLGIGTAAAVHHRPHITAAVAREIWPRIDRQLAGLPFTPFPIRLGGLLVFGARHPILVRSVVPTEELLTLQHQVHRIVTPCPGQPRNTGPGLWTPHVTLARRVPFGQLDAALHAVATEHDFPAVVVGIRRWHGDERREHVLIDGR